MNKTEESADLTEILLNAKTAMKPSLDTHPLPFPGGPEFQEIHGAAAEVLQSEPLPAEWERKTVEPGREPLPRGLTPLIGLSGKARAGKDTIADYILSRYAGVSRLNFSDPIIAEANAWLDGTGHQITEGNKSEPVYRHLLQSWGASRRTEESDYWTRQLQQRVKDLWAGGSTLVLLCGVRTPTDLELVEKLGGGHWRVIRPGNRYRAEHQIEKMLDELPRETMTVIENPAEGDLGVLYARVDAALAKS